MLLRRSAEVRRRLTALEQHRPAGDADLAALRADLGQALRHVAVVRYDAFGDMGGRLSFSAAVIDDHGDGLVFSSIHARGESRTYAKGVVGGTSRRHPHPRGAAGPGRCPHRQGDPVTRFGYLGPEGTFTSMALDAWGPAGGWRAHGLRLGRRGAGRPARRRHRRRDGADRELRRGRRLRHARRPRQRRPAGRHRRGAACRSPSCSRPAPAHARATCAPSAPTRTRGPRCAAGWASTCRMPCTCPTLSTAAAAAGSRAGPAGLRRRGRAPRAAARLHGLEVLADGIGDMQAAVTRFVLVARPGALPRADRRRQDDRRAVPARRPRRRPARAARAVRRPRHQHDPARVAPDQGVDGLATASRSTSRATCSTSGSARR